MLYQHVDSEQFRATLSMQLMAGGLISVIGIALGPGFGRDEIAVSLILLPGVILGYCVSRLAVPGVTTKAIRITVFISRHSGLLLSCLVPHWPGWWLNGLAPSVNNFADKMPSWNDMDNHLPFLMAK